MNKDHIFNLILKSIPAGIYWKSIDGKYLGCNPTFAKLVSLNNTMEIIGKDDSYLPWKKHIQRIEKNEKKMISEEIEIFDQYEITTENQQTITLGIKCAPLWDANKNIIGSIGTVEDITKTLSLEKALEIEKEKLERRDSQTLVYLENIVKNIPGSVYWKDLKGIYLGCNDYVAKMAGVNSPKDVIGKTDFELPWHAVAEDVWKIEEEIIKTGVAREFEESGTIASGKTVTFLAKKMPLYDTDNRIIGVIGTAIEISKRKEMESALLIAKEKAETANKAKSAFLATMSHELRTPLNGILGMVQILKKHTMPSSQTEYIDIIERSGKNLLALVNDIMDLSMIESGNIVLKESTFSFQTLLEDIMTSCRPLLKDKPVELLTRYNSPIPKYIVGDELRVRQIILNLIGNAIKFTSEGTITVDVKVMEAGGNKAKFQIVITDTGIGIPENKLEAIFERFTQVESNYDRRFEGAGLGLAIVQKLVYLMNGNISVTSKLGEGSQFTTELLLRVSNDIKKMDDNFTPANSNKYNVRALLVEDNLVNQKVACAFLQEYGVTVDVAATGKEAVNLYTNNQYDIVFMDLSLPDTDGLTVASTFKELPENYNIPIIALTAHVLDEDRDKCLSVGMREVITKPLARNELNRVLSTWTDPASS